MDTPGRGMIHVPGGTEQDSWSLRHATQNDAPFKICEMFLSGIFHDFST